jgi:hypothetical protein
MKLCRRRSLLSNAAIALFGTLAFSAFAAFAQSPALPRSYLVKLSVPVGTRQSKQGDPIKAAIISPESLLNGYLEGVIEERASNPAKLVLRFTKLQYKGKTTSIQTEVTDFVNSKGHKKVDDEEKPIKLESGAFSAQSDFWLDEGSELRLSAGQPKQ